MQTLRKGCRKVRWKERTSMPKMFQERQYGGEIMTREDTIEEIVRNYYFQVKIVGSTNVTLYDYLKGICLTPEEIEYALEYNSRGSEES